MTVFEPLSAEQMVDDWPEGLDHFSASGMKMAYRCPEQWRQRYILNLIEPPKSSFLWGRADHKASQVNYMQKLETFENLPVEDVAFAFAEALDVEVSESGGVGEVKWEGTPETDARKAAAWTKDKGVQLAAMYHEQVAPYFQPVTIEHEFELRLPLLPVVLVGRHDLIVTDTTAFGPSTDDELPLRLVDRKTSGGVPRQINPDWRLQASIYQLDAPIPHEWQVSVKPKEGKRKQNPSIVWGDPEFLMQPALDPSKVVRAVEMVVAEIGHFMRTLGPDEPWPPKGKYTPTWGGSACDYCGYRPVCFWWQP